MIGTTDIPERQEIKARPLAEEEPRLRPVLGWASVGAGFILFLLYLVTRWILSGNAKPVPKGPEPIPTQMEVAIHVYEAVICVVALTVIYYFVIRPWRRDGRFSFDGLLIMAMYTMWWQDALMNYSQVWFSYNTAFINLGSWYNFIPGWTSQNGHLQPEPIFGMLILYGPLLFMTAVIGNRLMNKIRRNWPRLGAFGGLVVCWFVLILVDVAMEMLFFLPLGMWTYPGSPRWMTVFDGHHYQLPVFEAMLAGALYTGVALLRYHKNDKGESLAERGLSRVSVPPTRRTLLRFLALAGVCNTVFLVGYNVPLSFIGLNSGPWPEDVSKRPYMDPYCGPHTTYACPSPATPIPRPNSARVGPDGTLVHPAVTR